MEKTSDDKYVEKDRPCGYGPGDCCGDCYVCGDNPENDREEDDA